MNRVLSLLFVLLAVAVSAVAQDSSGGRVFAGFSYLNIEAIDRENAFGFQGSYAHPLSDEYNFVADFGGQFGSLDFSDPLLGTFSLDFQNYEFLFGPEIRRGNDKKSAFLHALVGFAHARTSATTIIIFGQPIPIPSISDTGLAFGFGGGLDVSLNDRVSFRVVQVDYIPANLSEWSHNIRIGVGVVF